MLLVTTISERYLILSLLVFGLLFTGLSYSIKTSTRCNIKTVNIDEPYAKIDINKADAFELERLPGIGPVLAQEIVFYRDGVGRFKDTEELKNIKGIGDKKFEKIKDLVTISEKL